MLIDLRLAPGIYRQGTEYQAKGRYYDANLVRWYQGALRPVGGWMPLLSDVSQGYGQAGYSAGKYGVAKRPPQNVQGKARGAHVWSSTSNTNRDLFFALGTHSRLYVRQGLQTPFQDITPSGLMPGYPDSVINVGYGGAGYGRGAYGIQRESLNVALLATTWSLDNFGEFLVGVHSDDGRLLYWDLQTATALPVMATAGTTPINNRGVLVTDERFVMLFQANGSQRRVAWSDQENLFNWQITATTQSGDFDLQTSGEIMCAKRTRGQVLIITSVDAHVAQYIGPPLVYGFQQVGEGCGAISRNAAVVADKVVAWMGNNNFYVYDGYVKQIPSEVRDFVFTRLNVSQKAKVWASYDSVYNEVTWFYPASTEIDSYVTWNIAENHWSIGRMARTIGVDNQLIPKPVRVAPDGILYEHEIGFQYDGDMPFAETGPVELGNGEQVMSALYLYPDEQTQGDVQARFDTRFYPNAPEFKFGPYAMNNPTSVRFTGRQVVMRIEGIRNADWRVGVPRLDVRPGGLR